MARHLGNASVERGVDDGTAGRHRFELDEPEGLGTAHRGQDEDVGNVQEFYKLAVGNGTQQPNAILQAERADQLLQPQPLAALADNPDVEGLADGGTY